MKERRESKEIEALRLCILALEAQTSFWPVLRTRDCGSCKECGQYTSSGSIWICAKCAMKLANKAIEIAKKVINE